MTLIELVVEVPRERGVKKLAVKPQNLQQLQAALQASSEPPYLPIGTEVSAKYRGAFCEARVKKIVKSVKCRVFLKETQSALWLTDEYITGPLKLGAVVEVKHPDTGRIMEAVVKQMNDYSMYTVVFDDADERTLRRTQLCLKGDKHFIESETLDNLPLSNPEHFGTPVIAKGKRNRSGVGNDDDSDESSDDDGESPRRRYHGRNQDLVGKVMFHDSGDRKKTYLVPVLVVLPDAHVTELKTKDQLLVRSFKDSKFSAVTKKELTVFTREAVLKNEDKSLKPAMEKALLYIDNRELPLSWNKDELVGAEDDVTDEEESSDDDEPSEEKDHFVAQLYKFCDDRGTPINKGPSVGSKDLNLYKLFKIVQNLGGYNRVSNQMKWRLVYSKMLLPPSNTASTQIRNAYKKYLHAFEDFYRKLGSSMGTISRPGRNRHGSGRSILNFRDRDGVKNIDKSDSDKDKAMSEDAKSEFDSDGEKRAATPTSTPKRPKSARIKVEVKEDKVEEEKKEVKKEDKKETKKEESKELKVEESPKRALNKKSEEKDNKMEVEKKTMKKTAEVASKAKKEVDEEKEKELKDLQKKISRRRSTRTDDKLEDLEDAKTEKREEDAKKEKKEEDVRKDKKDDAKDKKKEETEEKKEMQEIDEKGKGKKKDEQDVEEKTERKAKKKVEPEVFEKPERRMKKKIDPDIDEKPEKKTQKKDELVVEEKSTKKKEAAKKASTPKPPDSGKDGDDSDGSDAVGHPPPASNTHNLPVGSRLKVRYGKGKNQVEYEAKILELGKDSGPKQYLVHYLGWNNRHDEWVKQERIVKVIERSDNKKKVAQKTSPKPVQKVAKKKVAIEKAPASPSSVKSDASNPSTTKPSAKATKAAPLASTTPSSGNTAAPAAGKPRPTRSNSIEINFAEGLPAKRRTRKVSGMFSSANGSDSDGSDKSDDEEVEKTSEKEVKLEAKTLMPAITPKKNDEDPHELDSSMERSPPQLSKMTDLVKDKVEIEEKVGESVEKFDVKDEPVAPVLKVIEIEKNRENSEPILEKLEAQLNSVNPPKAVNDAEMKDNDIKKKEPPEKKGKRAQAKIESEIPQRKAEKPKEEDFPDIVKENKEGSLYDFKDEPEEDLKVRDRRKPVILLQEVKVDSVKEVEPVQSVKPCPVVVKPTEMEELGTMVHSEPVQDMDNKSSTKDIKEIVVKPVASLFDEKETAKSDSEVDKVEKGRGRKKKIALKCDPKDIKKPKLNVAEKKINEITNANSEKNVPIISVSPERKPFITLAEKKQGFSPLVKKSPSVQVVKCSDADDTDLDIHSVDHEKEKGESKEDVKRIPEMVVVHKESPVKTDIVLGRKLELSEQERGDIDQVKNFDIDEDSKDGKDEIGNDIQGVKKKVRKKTKKKLEMDELERGGFFSRKIAKPRAPVSRMKPSISRRGRELNNREREKQDLNVVKDSPFDIDLRCEEQIRSRSVSPERIALGNDKSVVNADAAGFESLFEAVECRLKESQQGGSASQSKDEKTIKTMFENTPPTTPEHESDEASHQNSHHDQIKMSGKYSSEVSSKIDTSHTICNESPRGNQSPLSNNSSGSSSGGIAGSEGSVDVLVHTTKRRRDSDEPTPTKRRKRASRGKAAANRAKHLAESDSEEASNSVKGRSPHYSTDSYSCKVSSTSVARNRSPRPSKYNFNLEEGKYLEGNQRISFLVEKIQEIRRIYMSLKSEVACIDRRRKRMRRREKESTNSSGVEVECS